MFDFYQQLRMKYLVVCFCFVFFVKNSLAQRHTLFNAANGIEERVWLQNSKGKIIGDQDSVVSRDYFWASWVDVQSEYIFGDKIKYTLIIQPPTKDASLYQFTTKRFSEKVLRGIDNSERASIITLYVEEDNKDTKTKKIGSVRFILE